MAIEGILSVVAGAHLGHSDTVVRTSGLQHPSRIVAARSSLVVVAGPCRRRLTCGIPRCIGASIGRDGAAKSGPLRGDGEAGDERLFNTLKVVPAHTNSFAVRAPLEHEPLV